MRKKDRKIGEILVDNGLVGQSVVDEALRHQKEFGGNMAQYLIDKDYIKEEDLAKCISLQFGCPYLSLRAYDIRKEAVDLVPADVAEKYWVMPVDRIGDIVTIVMANPLDNEAIEAVEKATGCKVQPFVGMLSDIAKAIEHYYDILVGDQALIEHEKAAPLFIETPFYTGIDRRKSIRIKCKLDVHFVDPNMYQKAAYIRTETKDISTGGFLFESSNIMPVGAHLNMGMHMPGESGAYPINAVVQVIRVRHLGGGKFDVGVRIISIKKSDINKIIKYAITS